jgi:hypothetical protein
MLDDCVFSYIRGYTIPYVESTMNANYHYLSLEQLNHQVFFRRFTSPMLHIGESCQGTLVG